MSSEYCILICGCKKYESYLRAAIQYMKRPGVFIIGLMGDPALPTTQFHDDILTVNVNDTYEYLPLKMWTAIEWISRTWPSLSGIFKTDDDIRVHDVDHFMATIRQNMAVPFWGFVKEHVTGGVFQDGIINKRFTDKSLRPSYPSATYCYGHGYWLSAASIKAIVERGDIVQKYPASLEDVVMGHTLNQAGIFPTQIHLPYTELPRDDKLLAYVS